ncbi:hypothetical protein GZ982_30205 (plasmid) [Pseudomonas fluorescens]|nr:hypothetical protein GZ982_30205 [Pseudomonas fluorescens]
MLAEQKPTEPFGPTGRTFHVHLSVRGAIRDFSKRQLKGLFKLEDGRPCTADQAKDRLLECLAQGREVLPVGAPCEGFDYAGGGCPGHDHPPAGQNEAGQASRGAI